MGVVGFVERVEFREFKKFVSDYKVLSGRFGVCSCFWLFFGE